MTATQTEPSTGGRVAVGGVHRLQVVFSSSVQELGQSRTLGGPGLVIGRDPERQPSLVLRHGRVSRRHARIEATGGVGRWRVVDAGSRNGTFLNGRPITEAELEDGDIVRVGPCLLLFQFLDLEACELVVETHRAPMFGMVGQGHGIARVRQEIRRAPRAMATLVQGETGVGKELVARAIHDHSGRAGAFVPVNCSALPKSLAESELFGHVRNAFTGADNRKGLFGRADKGTLFLDEIGDISLEVQAKLLRALALGEVRPVGSDEPRHVDVAVVAATNVNLEDAVSEGRFRPDLHARLMGHVVTVPPLRQRREDIIELVNHFTSEIGKPQLTADCAEALLTYDWPYNIRELEQVMASIAPKSETRGQVELEDLPRRLRAKLEARFQSAATSEPMPVPVSLLDLRRHGTPNESELRAALEAYRGNVARVAAFFGKDRRQIYRWADALHIDIRSARD